MRYYKRRFVEDYEPEYPENPNLLNLIDYYMDCGKSEEEATYLADVDLGLEYEYTNDDDKYDMDGYYNQQDERYVENESMKRHHSRRFSEDFHYPADMAQEMYLKQLGATQADLKELCELRKEYLDAIDEPISSDNELNAIYELKAELDELIKNYTREHSYNEGLFHTKEDDQREINRYVKAEKDSIEEVRHTFDKFSYSNKGNAEITCLQIHNDRDLKESKHIVLFVKNITGSTYRTLRGMLRQSLEKKGFTIKKIDHEDKLNSLGRTEELHGEHRVDIYVKETK